MGCGCTYQGTYRYKLTPAKSVKKRKAQLPLFPSEQVPSQINLSTLKKTAISNRQNSRIERREMGPSQPMQFEDTRRIDGEALPIPADNQQIRRSVQEFNRRTVLETRYPKGDSPQKPLATKTILRRTDSLDFPTYNSQNASQPASTTELFPIPRNMSTILPAPIQSLPALGLNNPPHHKLTMNEVNTGSRVEHPLAFLIK